MDEIKMEPMRDATAPARKIWLVTPFGFPKCVPVAANIQNGHTFIDQDGAIRLRSKDVKAGWSFLEDKVTPAEFKTWVDYHAKAAAAAAAGMRMKPLPPELWPKGIKNPADSVMPEVDYDPESPAPKPAPKPEGGATTTKSMKG